MITSPPVPCVLCLAEAAEEEPVGRPTRPPGRSPGHRPSLRAPPPRARHSFDGQIPFTPRAALATTPRSGSSRSRPPHRRSQSPPLASSLDSTTAISCRAGAVPRYTLPFLRRAPLRLANGGAGQQRSSTDHHHDTTAHLCVCREIAVSRSGNCRLLWAGAIPALFRLLFLCYACVIHALFMRHSCTINAPFLRFPAAIPALFL